jgi:hypothetical protein
MLAIMGNGGAVTSVMIYSADLDRLRTKQLNMSAERGRKMTMPEIIRELIETAESTGQGA